MRMKLMKGLIIGLAIMIVAIPSYAGHAVMLSDEELDQVSAKGIPDVYWEILSFSSIDGANYASGVFSGDYIGYNLGNGNTVFTLNGQAQQNLQSMANIIAVNSTVNCQINLTVIGGNLTGTLTQTNTATLTNFYPVI